MDSSIQKSPASASSKESSANTSLYAIAGFCIAAMLTVLVGFAVVAPDDFRLALAKIASFLVTPFILEPLLFVMFFTAVVLINRWRRNRDGDEWVYLMDDEVINQSTQRSGVHDAVFTSPPTVIDESVELEVINGLVDMGAIEDALERLAALSPECLDSEAGLHTRLKVAIASGKSELALRLQALLTKVEADRKM